MTPAIYHVRFSSSVSNVTGEGLAVFREGTINGGDLGYSYVGTYEIGKAQLSAKIRIKRWNPSIVSVFGNFPEFDLDLHAPLPTRWDSFSIAGVVVQRPEMRISIGARRLADAA